MRRLLIAPRFTGSSLPQCVRSWATRYQASSPGPWSITPLKFSSGYVNAGRMPLGRFGDFNRYSIPDLVMDGTDGRRSLRVALVSTGHTYRLLILNALPLSDQLLHNSIEFLAYEAPGTVDTLACNEQEDQCHAVPFHFAADAFQVVFFEKASSLWYWTGDGFTESSTSD